MMETPQIPAEVWPLLWDIWEWAQPKWKELTATAFAFVLTIGLLKAVRRRGGS